MAKVKTKARPRTRSIQSVLGLPANTNIRFLGRRGGFPNVIGGGGNLPGRFLYRVFQLADLPLVTQGFDFGPFDGFEAGAVDENAAPIAQLIARGKRFWRYFSIFDFPWRGTEDSWFDWLRANVQNPTGGMNARFIDGGNRGLFSCFSIPDGGHCAPPSAEYREIINWNVPTAGQRTTILNKMFSFTPAGQSIRFDQTFLEPPDYFWATDPAEICDAHSPIRSCVEGVQYPPAARAPFVATFPTHTANMHAFITEANQIAAARGSWVCCNGQANVEAETINGLKCPRPLVLENAGDPAGNGITAFKLARWKEDPRNILELKLPNAAAQSLSTVSAFQQLKDEIRHHKGWVAFNLSSGALPPPGLLDSQDPNVMEAYRTMGRIING